MTTKHQITGLGPKKADGSMFIFTARREPFTVTAEWLDEQKKEPAVGEFIDINDDGTLSLMTEAPPKPRLETRPVDESSSPRAPAPLPLSAAQRAAAEKKSPGSLDSNDGLENFLGRKLLGASAIAAICHEANRAYCCEIGDYSQLPWEDAPQWQRISAEKGVDFNIANPSAPASASHESWLEVKRADGWTYGPLKDPEKKEHPCFMPYDGLPVEQRRKDALFKAIVGALTQE